MISRLILVEGMPGSGKTTVARFLSDCFARLGVRCTACYETDEHPVGMHYGVVKHERMDDYLTKAPSIWREWARSAADDQAVTIMDGRLLQNCVFGLLLENVEEEHILSFLRQLIGAAEPLAPVLIYLFQRDYVATLRAMCKRRGAGTEQAYIRRNEDSEFGRSRKLRGWGGLLEFWLEHKRLTEILVSEWSAPKLLIDNTRRDELEDQKKVLSFVYEYVLSGLR